MPKTRDAFAFRGFNEKQILQLRFFKAWRERYKIRTDVKSDSDIVHSDSVMLDFVDGDTEKEKLQKAERYNQQLKELHTALATLKNLIARHVERLEKYRRAVQAKIDAADENQRQSLQSKIEREQRLATSYIFVVSFAVTDLIADVQKRWLASEQNLQSEYRRRFGERLKQAREKAGLSRKELGDAINISPGGYGLYERGARDVTPTSLIRLSRKLKVSADWLIGLE